MAAYNLASGSIIHHQLNPTRTEEDFCHFIQQSCQPLLVDPQAEVILLADQLNTHLSESLVLWVAHQIGFTAELGKKGQCGILHNQASPMAFLEEESHRIRFVFSPKHCSWLNPIENCFAKLSPRSLKTPVFAPLKNLTPEFKHISATITITWLKPSNGSSRASTKTQP